MASFAEALRTGLATHEQAEQARAEMNEVLATASKDVTEVMQVEILLQFQVVDRPARPQSAIETVASIPAPREKFTGLTAKTRNGRFSVLAEAKFGDGGYPVNLRWEGDSYWISDRAEFEQALHELLAHGATGAKLTALIAGK